MAMQMRSWQLGCIVIGLLVSASAGCKKDKDDNEPVGGNAGAGEEGGNTSSGGRHTGGNQNDAGTPTTSGGDGNAGTPTTTGGIGQAGEETGGTGQAGTLTGGQRTGGNGGDETTGGSRSGGAGGTTGGGGPTGGVEESGGTAGDTGNGGDGTGGTVPTGEIGDLITAMCSWEFTCCDTGELNYRMSPFITDMETCVDDFTYELEESNGTDNPYVSGYATGLLGTLGYTIDLSRVSVNAENVAACAEQLNAIPCPEYVVADPSPVHCVAGSGAVENPCALDNLFSPALQLGDRCTLGLAEAGGMNDIECPVGSTCLDETDPDNPNNYPSCVSRGLDGDHCTEDGDCDFGFYCADGSCALLRAEDESCSYNVAADPAPGEENDKCGPGLTCDPLTLTCLAACTEDALCTANGQCPDGYGCVPLEVNDDTTVFQVCKPLGTTAADLCNDDDDCASTRHCSDGVCQADVNLNGDCVAPNECAAGLHCELWDTGTCVTNVAAGEECDPLYPEQCGPGSKGCLNVGDITDPADGINETVCRTTLLSNGTVCGEDRACLSGLCEVVSVADEGDPAADPPVLPTKKCTAGADLGDECDGDDLTAADGLRCGTGLLCWTTGECIEKAGPGMPCLDPDGTTDTNMCASNSACAEVWAGEGEICTDAALPETVTCDSL